METKHGSGNNGQPKWEISDNVYRGTFDAFSSAEHYDHQLIDTSYCHLSLPLASLDGEYPNQTSYYYLITAENPCDGLEGNYGYDSTESLRPTTADLGRPGC